MRQKSKKAADSEAKLQIAFKGIQEWLLKTPLKLLTKL